MFLLPANRGAGFQPHGAGPTVLPASDREPQNFVILIHRYGSNDGDLIGLVPYSQNVLPEPAYVARNAPARCPDAPDGYL
jgi:phospholipase/carboxylesterase